MGFDDSEQQTRADAVELDLGDDPALIAAHLLAGGLMEICGPLFWGALIVGWLFAAFVSGG